ncbi:hypothetical protein LUZ61_003293 [Rhynchospora tenuis]|uniref:Xanthine/uracil permease n=1 Tax=Rhynchospora tenuis TaxID=198213 RepID=A0AAD5ZKL4_9POAL|nr:hypothetical protein LUZ61_003293 [Rhynchospora tenuis]
MNPPQSGRIARLNSAVAGSRIGKWFKLTDRNTTFTTELRAGTATFLTMAYILAVNASILSDSGATCTISDCINPSPTCKFPPNVDPGYESCVSNARHDLIVATAIASLVGSFIMGVFANLPLGLAPGMGANAYFAYSIVGFHGSGSLSYGDALAVVFMEGLVFLLISVCGFRAKLAKMVPQPVRVSASAGIGLFLAFIGLQNQQGIGLVGYSPSTLLTLAACPSSDMVSVAPVQTFSNGTIALMPGTTASGAIYCLHGHMQSPTFWLGTVGFLIIAFCLIYRVKGAIIYGIIFVTAISWFRGTSVTAFPNTPAGNEAYSYFKNVVDVHHIKSTAFALKFGSMGKGRFWLAFLTFLYVDVLDTTGTLYSMARFAGFVDEKGNFEGQTFAFMSDATAIVFGSLMGSSPVTAFIESSTGIREGGRTGLTALTVSGWFFLSYFFTPLLASIPGWAVGPPMIVVGVFMMRAVTDVRWDDMKEAVPAFLTLILMPLTYSIAYGVIGGIGAYIVLNLPDWIWSAYKRISGARRLHEDHGDLTHVIQDTDDKDNEVV